jgi:hypothetical protein
VAAPDADGEDVPTDNTSDDTDSTGLCGAAGVMAVVAMVLAGFCLSYTETEE